MWICPRCKAEIDKCDFSHFHIAMQKGYLYVCMNCYRELYKESGKN
jgi:hypothetical protein